MGRKIHLGVEELFNKSFVVDFKSLQRVVNHRGESSYTRLLVSNLIKQGKIRRIGKGLYTRHDESTLAVFAYQPAYLGLQSALSHNGLWEQETIPVIITTRKVRRGIREVLGTNVLIRNIDRKHFFGFEHDKEGEFYLPYSDVEKTVIDMVAYNQSMDGEVVRRAKKAIDKDKLERYLQHYSSRVGERVRKLLS